GLGVDRPTRVEVSPRAEVEMQPWIVEVVGVGRDVGGLDALTRWVVADRGHALAVAERSPAVHGAEKPTLAVVCADARVADAGATCAEQTEHQHTRYLAHHSMALYSTVTTSSSRSPLGSLRSASSPACLPMRARARGELIETLPRSTSVSSSPTMM